MKFTVTVSPDLASLGLSAAMTLPVDSATARTITAFCTAVSPRASNVLGRELRHYTFLGGVSHWGKIGVGSLPQPLLELGKPCWTGLQGTFPRSFAGFFPLSDLQLSQNQA